MQFFIDTAEISEIEELNELGIIDGVTTNPSLIAKNGGDIKDVIKQICKIISGPVSAEVNSNFCDEMVKEGKILAGIAENVVVKLPMTLDGVKACSILSASDIPVNMTLCFSVSQAILAAKAGAAYVSPFIGRLDDISQSGLSLISDICQVYSNYMFETEILAASIRHTQHVIEVAKLGVDVATMPAKLIKQLIEHPLTDAGIEIFNQASKGGK